MKMELHCRFHQLNQMSVATFLLQPVGQAAAPTNNFPNSKVGSTVGPAKRLLNTALTIGTSV